MRIKNDVSPMFVYLRVGTLKLGSSFVMYKFNLDQLRMMSAETIFGPSTS